MARPRKTSQDEMLKIVNSFFETNGNPAMLKCSYLEEYAVSMGVNIKAYDFRRNEAVRKRMDELRTSIKIDGHGAIAYKSLDVDALLSRNYTQEMLRNSLLELDETWRRIYDKVAELSEKNKTLLADVFAKKQIIDDITAEKDILVAESKNSDTLSKRLIVENRYLKKMLKQYLYPAIANEILREENVLEQIDTEVTKEAMAELVDHAIPASFSHSIETDTQTISREESLLERMRNQIKEGYNNAT